MFETLESRRLFAVSVLNPAYASFDSATKALTVYGTAGVDVIGSWCSSGSRGLFRGDANFVSWLPGDVATISVETGAGNDSIYISVDTNVSTTILGGSGNDTIKGGGGSDSISGGDGDDLIDGGWGNDTLIGAAGKDTLLASFGADDYQGGAQRDVLDCSVMIWDATITQDTAGLSSQAGVVANDTVGDYTDMFDNVLGDIETILLGAGNDYVALGSADNYVDGGAGNDTLDGGSGNDTIVGGDGNDLLNGTSGNDVFFAHDVGTGPGGNPFADSINGGSGDDVLGEAADPTDVVNL